MRYPTLQIQDFLIGHESKLPLPTLDGDNTIFEYLVNEAGEWEHWANRVRHIRISILVLPNIIEIIITLTMKQLTAFIIYIFFQVPDYEYPSDSIPDYLTILVPNVDNVRTDFLIQTISKQDKPVLLIGEQGSAKTVMVQGYCGKYDPEVQMFKSFNFSSASTPFMFQVRLIIYISSTNHTYRYVEIN